MATREEFEKKQDNFELKKFVNLIIARWYWVAGCLLFALIIAFLIIRYEDPVYVVNASFITKKFDDRLSTTSQILQPEGSGHLGSE